LRVRATPVPLDGVEAAALLKPLPLTVEELAWRGTGMGRDVAKRAAAAQLRACGRAYALAAAVQDRLRSEVLENPTSRVQHGRLSAELGPARVGLSARLAELTRDPADLRAAVVAFATRCPWMMNYYRVYANEIGVAGLPEMLRAREQQLLQ